MFTDLVARLYEDLKGRFINSPKHFMKQDYEDEYHNGTYINKCKRFMKHIRRKNMQAYVIIQFHLCYEKEENHGVKE